MNSAQDEFRIVVPVFNEEKTLEKILMLLERAGYLSRVSFVNDASTDLSREILEHWKRKSGIHV